MTYLLLLLFFAVEYVRPTSYVPALMVLRLNSLIPMGSFVGTVSSGSIGRAGKWIWNEKNAACVATFVLILLASVLTAEVRMYAWDRFTAVLGYAIISWVLFAELTSINRIQGVFITLIVVHLIVAALNPILFTNPEARNYIASGSFLGDGNDFALSLDIVVPFCLFLFLNAKGWQKPFWVVGMLVMIACIILSQSRGGTLGLIAMGVYYWLKSPKKVQTGLVATIVVGLTVVLAPGAYFTRMQQMGDTNEGSASARITAWNAGVKMAMDHPIFGVGAGNFPQAMDTTYRPPDYDGPGKTAHSVYFLALGELGFPGVGLIIYFILVNLAANRRLAIEIEERLGPRAIELQLLASTSAGLISFTVAGAFLSALYYPHWFVLAGIMAATRHIVRERARQHATPSAAEPERTVTIHPMLRPAPRPALAPPMARRQLPSR